MPAAPCSNIDSQLILREAIKLIAQANIRSLVNACEHGREQKQRPSVSYTGALSLRSPYRQQFRHQPTAKEEAPVALLEKTVKSSSHLRH